MRKLAVLLILVILSFISPSCVKEVVKEVVVTDTLVVRDTLTVRDTITVRDTVLDLACGLLAYYPFNGNFKDESGHGNDAVGRNGIFLTTDYKDEANRSAGFDGLNDYLIVQNGKPLRSDTMTLSVHIYSDSWDLERSILALHDFTDGSSFHYNLVQPFGGTQELAFSIGDPAYPCTGLQHYNPSISIISTQKVTTSKWYHLLATFANGDQRFYIDGQLVGQKTQPYKAVRDCGNPSLIIGGWWQSSLFPFSGKIDEIRIYNRLLNKCEINAIDLDGDTGS
ncbi:LamG domain-containing protein [Flavihumibacter solisilvae]|uniref:LamG-like jellyroll fold domain-containing protein n=1 Tax=Flavihumibacter solisilvae TaxID=1349421 RepID=A0A0C1ITY0_9BACT|nr:LamG domain-containing protein [Flavihumibacter solisilvae]KIC93904.1 hypothetical protein OI18_15060 [Flavihumibacter solisilvae]